MIHEVVAGSSVPLVFNNQSILPYNQQTCQCECNAPLGDVVVIGEFCEDTLNGNETLCYYSCVDTSSCREVLKSWHVQYVYSSYPNTYTDDIRYMYEDMKLRNVVQDVRLSHMFRGGSIFMCMDAAVDTGPAVYLSPVEDHGVIPTIVSVDASTSGAMCTAGDISGLLRFLFLCFLWFVV